MNGSTMHMYVCNLEKQERESLRTTIYSPHKREIRSTKVSLDTR